MKASLMALIFLFCTALALPLRGQLTLTLGVDTSLTQSANSNGNADAAFDTWTQSIIATTPSISTWNSSAEHAAGTIGSFVMDTGVNSTSPFGAAPSTGNTTSATTRSYGSSSFTYTLHSVRQFDTTPPSSSSPSGWNLLPTGATLLGSSTGILREEANASNRATTLSAANFEYRIESPASQDSANVSPDGRNTWGFDGLAISPDNNRRGFVLSFSTPLSAFGFFAADFESTDTNGFWGLVAIFDSSGNLLDQQVVDYPGTADGDERESFIGIKYHQQKISHAVFFVGSTNNTPTAANSRQNSYAFGGFTFLETELIPEPQQVACAALAVLWLAVVIFRRCQRPQAAG